MEYKNLLYIAYYFPPVGGGGVQRTTQTIKYLSQLGWNITVITVDYPSYDVYDSSLMNYIPDTVEVIRLPTLKNVIRKKDTLNNKKNTQLRVVSGVCI